MTHPTIADTLNYIRALYGTVPDRGGEVLAVRHPMRVMDRLVDTCSAFELHAALLHDVMEDYGVSRGMLALRGYDERVIALVERLSRPAGPNRPSYIDWIRSIAASGDAGLIRIKIADNEDNLGRVDTLPPGERDIKRRYYKSLAILTEALADIERSKVEAS